MVGLPVLQEVNQPPTYCNVNLTSLMAMYNKQPYHYMMLATTFHPLAYLQEWNLPLEIRFEERLVVIYSKQIPLLQKT